MGAGRQVERRPPAAPGVRAQVGGQLGGLPGAVVDAQVDAGDPAVGGGPGDAADLAACLDRHGSAGQPRGHPDGPEGVDAGHHRHEDRPARPAAGDPGGGDRPRGAQPQPGDPLGSAVLSRQAGGEHPRRVAVRRGERPPAHRSDEPGAAGDDVGPRQRHDQPVGPLHHQVQRVVRGVRDRQPERGQQLGDREAGPGLLAEAVPAGTVVDAREEGLTLLPREAREPGRVDHRTGAVRGLYLEAPPVGVDDRRAHRHVGDVEVLDGGDQRRARPVVRAVDRRCGRTRQLGADPRLLPGQHDPRRGQGADAGHAQRRRTPAHATVVGGHPSPQRRAARDQGRERLQPQQRLVGGAHQLHAQLDQRQRGVVDDDLAEVVQHAATARGQGQLDQPDGSEGPGGVPDGDRTHDPTGAVSDAAACGPARAARRRRSRSSRRSTRRGDASRPRRVVPSRTPRPRWAAGCRCRAGPAG